MGATAEGWRDELGTLKEHQAFEIEALKAFVAQVPFIPWRKFSHYATSRWRSTMYMHRSMKRHNDCVRVCWLALSELSWIVMCLRTRFGRGWKSY